MERLSEDPISESVKERGEKMSLAKHRELEHYHFDYSKCISPERWPARLKYRREEKRKQEVKCKKCTEEKAK